MVLAGSKYGHYWRLPFEHAYIAGFSWLTFLAGCYLLWRGSSNPVRPLSTSWRRVLLVLGWSSLAGRTAHEAYLMLSPVEPKLLPMFKGGQVHAGFVMTSMFDFAVPLSVLPAWLRVTLLVQRWSLFLAIMHRYLPPGHTLSSWMMFVLQHGVLVWAAVLLPYMYMWLRTTANNSKRTGLKVPAELPASSKAGLQPAQTPPGGDEAAITGAPSTSKAQQARQHPNRHGADHSNSGLTAHLGEQPLTKQQQAAAMLRRMEQQPYKRKLGTSHKVNLKLFTDQPYESLPCDLAVMMQQALDRCGSHQRMMDLAVRPGCITLSFSLVDCGGQAAARKRPAIPLGPSQASSSGGGGGDGGGSMPARSSSNPARGPAGAQQLGSPSTGAISAQQCAGEVAQMLLPELQRQLPDLNVQKGAAPPTHLLQVSDQVFKVVWCADSASWQLQPPQQQQQGEEGHDAAAAAAAAAAEAAHLQPWLGVARVVQQQALATTHSSRPTQAAGSKGTHSSTETTTGADSMVQLLVEVQLWELGKLVEVQGWEPPAAGAQPLHDVCTAPGGSPLCLLAKGGLFGGYLTTRVLRVVRTPGMPRLSTAQVVAELPPQCLVRHHPDGQPSSLQLLSLELWQDNVCISSCPLPSAHPMDPSNSQASGGPSTACTPRVGGSAPALLPSLADWWWGASTSTVAAAVSELQATTGALALVAGGAEDALPAYLAFLQDLCLWLVEVHATATTARICLSSGSGVNSVHSGKLGGPKQPTGSKHPAGDVAAAPPGWLKQPCLPLSQQQLLAEGLMDFAAAVGLVSVQRMLRVQLQQATHALAGTTNTHQTQQQHVQPVSWVSCARSVLVGYPCHLCEQQYKQQLAQQRQGSMVAMHVLVALVGAAMSARSAQEGDWSHVACAAPWTLLHVRELALARLQMPTSKDRSSTSKQHSTFLATWGPALPWFFRIGCRWLYALGVLPTTVILLSSHQAHIVWPLIHLTLALTEQVQASTVIPAAWVLLVACGLDVPAMLGHVVRQRLGPFWLLASGLPLMMVVPRMVLDAHMRSQFQNRRSTTA